MRLFARLAWALSHLLTILPRTTGVHWWSRALSRFASTGQKRITSVTRTHCVHGHELTEANVYTWQGRRACRACNRIAQIKYRNRNMLAVAAALLLCASVASAGPIQASHSGCVTDLTGGASFVGPAEGFVFMAFHDPDAGCAPTIRNNTHGFHLITVSATEYRVDVLAKWLPSCGKVQFDAHSYNSTGLDPFGLTALIFDTGIDCAIAPLSVDNGGAGVSRLSVHDADRTPLSTVPPSFSVPPTPETPVPVPDGGSAVVLWALGLVGLCGLRQSKLGCGKDVLVQKAMAGRAQHPKHVGFTVFHLPPNSPPSVFWTMSQFNDSCLAARLAGRGQVWEFAAHSCYDSRILELAAGIVNLLRAWILSMEGPALLFRGLLSANVRAVAAIAVRPNDWEMRRADSTELSAFGFVRLFFSSQSPSPRRASDRTEHFVWPFCSEANATTRTE